MDLEVSAQETICWTECYQKEDLAFLLWSEALPIKFGAEMEAILEILNKEEFNTGN